MSTAIICIILLIAVCIGIRSIIKRAASGCCGSGGGEKVRADKDLSHYSYTYMIGIDGMHCNHCKQTVENALNSLGGIYAVADIGKNSAVVYSKEKCDELRIKNIISSCGFRAKSIELRDEK